MFGTSSFLQDVALFYYKYVYHTSAWHSKIIIKSEINGQVDKKVVTLWTVADNCSIFKTSQVDFVSLYK